MLIYSQHLLLYRLRQSVLKSLVLGLRQLFGGDVLESIPGSIQDLGQLLAEDSLCVQGLQVPECGL